MASERNGEDPSPAPEQPTVLVARTTPFLKKQRRAMVSYCANSGLQVLPKDRWPSAPDDFRKSFCESLKRAHVFVQLLSEHYDDPTADFPGGLEVFQFEQATKAGLKILQWRDRDTDLDEIEHKPVRDLVASPYVRTDLPSTFHQEVVVAANTAFAIGQDATHGRENSTNAKLVLLKADATDMECAETLVEWLSKAGIRCRVSQNGVPMVERLRSMRFDALVVVLGHCSGDWIEERGDELMAVDLNLKDQVPLEVYCHFHGRKMPPYFRRDMLQVVAPAELSRLVQAIQERP